MNFDEEDDLLLEHLAGGNIVKYAPVFTAEGRFLLVRCGLKVQIYVCGTGELTRELGGVKHPLISLELDPKQPEILIGCTNQGELLRWHWRTGVLQKTTKINLNGTEFQILTCNLLNLYQNSDTACAFVTAKRKSGQHLDWFLINTSTGSVIPTNCTMQLKIRPPLVNVAKGQLRYMIISQGAYVFFVNYKKWEFVRYKNANNINITCVQFSPVEKLAATGDENGRIFLWRQFANQKTMINVLCHWHHTPVTSIAFTPTGSTFYSSGQEAVLVKWPIAQPENRKYLPRISSIIRHIAISDGNEHVVISTDDNAVQFVGASDYQLKSTLQNFTYEVPDKTGRSIFPIGLHLNPRSNSLVLNGRSGYLQFYSAYSKSLLYNVRVVENNIQSLETERIVYNARITRAAFNINWMATGEEYDDVKNHTKVQLKFWKYDEKLQRYDLNTHIEQPHGYGFHSIIFSNQYQIENLLCATAGKDDVIKVWHLAESENIYKKGTVMWTCMSSTTYRSYPIRSICFSQDSSLLGAGFGNTFCLYKPRTMQLMNALSTPPGYDGIAAKAQLRLCENPINTSRKDVVEIRMKLLGIMRALLHSDDPKLVEEARQLINKKFNQDNGNDKIEEGEKFENSNGLRKDVYSHIMKMQQLNLHQKLQLFRRFGIKFNVHEKQRADFIKYIQRCPMDPKTMGLQLRTLKERIKHIHVKHRCKAKQRLQAYIARKQQYEKHVKEDVLPLLSVLQLETHSKASKHARVTPILTQQKPLPKSSAPMQVLARITHVQFGQNEQAHLVAVCTETRVLIWNLLTLRLCASLKISVRHWTFDPLTNLIAAVTKNDELYVFPLNGPVPVYQRHSVPKLYGIVWLPRRQPKHTSINIEWQAKSRLHMLTEAQEIIHLTKECTPQSSEDEDRQPPSISFANAVDEPQYATFGNYVFKQRQQTLQNGLGGTLAKSSGPLIVGRGKENVVNMLINLAAHTMPSMSLLCGDFIKSLLTPAETDIRHKEQQIQATQVNGTVNGNGLTHKGSDSEDEVMEVPTDQLPDHALAIRKVLLPNTYDDNKRVEVTTTLDDQLQRLTLRQVNLQL